jgi:hypothetical protein
MDKQEYTKQMNAPNSLDLQPNWLNYGLKQLEWMAKCSLWKQGRPTNEEATIFKQFLDIKMPVITDGKLADWF